MRLFNLDEKRGTKMTILGVLCCSVIMIGGHFAGVPTDVTKPLALIIAGQFGLYVGGKKYGDAVKGKEAAKKE